MGKLSAVLTILFALSVFGIASADEYWVSFSGDAEFGPDPVYLMKIDEAGNILQAPVAVIPASKLGSGANRVTALAHFGSRRLLLWVATDSGDVYRAIITKQNMTLRSLKRLPIPASYNNDNVFLQATQNGTRFLAASTSGFILKGFPYTSKGNWTGTSFRLSPRTDNGTDQGSISADGRVAVATIFNAPFALYVQMLNSSGTPVGDPEVIASGNELQALDVSNAINGRRFVAYVEDEASTPSDDLLFVQRIDATSGQKVGQRVLFNVPENRGEDGQSVAVDPDARFIVFTLEVAGQACPGEDLIFYQAMDSKGNPVDELINLAPCGLSDDDLMGVDILKE